MMFNAMMNISTNVVDAGVNDPRIARIPRIGSVIANQAAVAIRPGNRRKKDRCNFKKFPFDNQTGTLMPATMDSITATTSLADALTVLGETRCASVALDKL